MAWPYGGDFRGLTLAQLPYVVEALCLAVDEREGVLGNDPVEWELVPGGATYSPLYAYDLQGLAGHEYGHIAGQLADYIEWGDWYTAGGVLLEHEDALAVVEGVAVSEGWLGGGPVVACERWQEASFWMTVRAFLDQYYIWRHTQVISGPDSDSTFSASGDVPDDYADGDAALAAAWGNEDTPGEGLGYVVAESWAASLDPVVSTHGVSANINPEVSVVGLTYSDPPGDGEVVAVRVTFSVRGFSQPSTTFDFLGETFTITAQDAYVVDAGEDGGWAGPYAEFMDGGLLGTVPVAGSYPLVMSVPEEVELSENYNFPRADQSPPLGDNIVQEYLAMVSLAAINVITLHSYVDVTDLLTDKA